MSDTNYNQGKPKKEKLVELPKYAASKLAKSEIMEFANFAIKIPKVVRILNEKEKWRMKSHEEMEQGEENFTKLVREYLQEKSMHQRLGLAYKKVFHLFLMQIRGQIDSVTSDLARAALNNGLIVEFEND